MTNYTRKICITMVPLPVTFVVTLSTTEHSYWSMRNYTKRNHITRQNSVHNKVITEIQNLEMRIGHNKSLDVNNAISKEEIDLL